MSAAPPSEAAARRLGMRSPATLREPHHRRAAVAMILRDRGGGRELLFIRRATRREDPWSGQIALPGGAREADDRDEVSTACRETREELGLPLSRAMLIGRVDDQRGGGRTPAIIVSCHVFALPRTQAQPRLRPHREEVADAFWIPAAHLAAPANTFPYRPPRLGYTVPAVRLPNGRVLWGMTHRFVRNFLEMVPAG